MLYQDNRREMALDIFHTFDGCVPDEVLKAFIKAIMDSDDLPGSTEPDGRGLLVVHGDAFWDGGPLFMAYDVAICYAEYYLARDSSRTYSEFLDALPENGYAETIRAWVNDGMPEYHSFDQYFSEYRKEHQEACLEEVWNAYLELNPVLERPPFEDEEFDSSTWQYFEFNYDVGPRNPQIDMCGFVPNSIEEEFGEVGDGVWDGPYLEFKCEDEEAIVAAWRKLNYTLLRDELLINAACGEINDPEAVRSRIKQYEDLNSVLEEASANHTARGNSTQA